MSTLTDAQGTRESQREVLTHVELFLARAAPPGGLAVLGIYEVPRYEGDEPGPQFANVLSEI